MHPLGIAAGLATAIAWAVCAMFFTSSSRRIGVFAMNNWRVLFGFLLLLVTQIATTGSPIPRANATQWWLLVASGFLGVYVGDTFLFQALHDVGPRLGLALFNVMPITTALLAWPILGEKLGLVAWSGIALTVAGATWVLAEEHRGDPAVRNPKIARGVLFILLAALTCGFGYIVAKPAMEGPDGASPMTAALIRVGIALLCFWATSLARGRLRIVARAVRDVRSTLYLAGGAVAGPFLGIWLSMVAVRLVPTGIASTLFATMPLMILPLVILFYHERVSWRAALGAALTVTGVAILANA